jgi:BON domain
MRERTVFVVGAGLGAGFMYVLDPQGGRRRRALARDRAVHLARKSDDALDATMRDVANRARGIAAEVRTLFAADEDVPDAVLEERVRAALGRCCAHPAAIEVTASEGRVALRGAVLSTDVGPVIRAVRRLRGVRRVDDRLEVHQTAEGVPGLQGGAARTERGRSLLPRRWSPTGRVLVGVGGLAVLASRAARRALLGSVVGGVGAALLARALRAGAGPGAGRQSADAEPASPAPESAGAPDRPAEEYVH